MPGAPASAAGGRDQLLQCADQPVDLFAGIVEGKGCTHRGLLAKAAQNGLGAVMAGADCNAFLIQRGTDGGGIESVDHEGQHARFVRRRAYDLQPGDGEDALRGIGRS